MPPAATCWSPELTAHAMATRPACHTLSRPPGLTGSARPRQPGRGRVIRPSGCGSLLPRCQPAPAPTPVLAGSTLPARRPPPRKQFAHQRQHRAGPVGRGLLRQCVTGRQRDPVDGQCSNPVQAKARALRWRLPGQPPGGLKGFGGGRCYLQCVWLSADFAQYSPGMAIICLLVCIKHVS